MRVHRPSYAEERLDCSEKCSNVGVYSELHVVFFIYIQLTALQYSLAYNKRIWRIHDIWCIWSETET